MVFCVIFAIEVLLILRGFGKATTLDFDSWRLFGKANPANRNPKNKPNMRKHPGEESMGVIIRSSSLQMTAATLERRGCVGKTQL